MRVGIGLPSDIPGVTGSLVVEWARRADTGPFTSLGLIDRLVYDSYEPLAALSGAAAVTQRVRLVTMVAIGPLRNTLLLARMAATVQALSTGRLVLGLAVGAREEDYQAAGVDYHSRGRVLSEQLAALRDLWEDTRLGPSVARAQPPELLVGGLSDATFARVARYADGYVHNGGPPRAFNRSADKARAAWSDAGRPGRPKLWGQSYFALGGDSTLDAARAHLRDYYAFTGPFVERIAAGLLTTPQAIAQQVRGYAEAGCDELVLLPTVADLDQLARLADVIGAVEGVQVTCGERPPD
jgi:alkanesulfonate monooxygenase SsuD/methylene tetrahydromethanopterin reductase-like flavin-dependent oxidoreductase (luciferase family)